MTGPKLRLDEMLPGIKKKRALAPPRSCGGCQACCDVMPVLEIGKPARTPCPNMICGPVSSGKTGCAIYETRPASCRYWSCAWLLLPEVLQDDALRPDRSHVIFDILMARTGLGTEDKVDDRFWSVNLWVDLAYPDAHRAPNVRKVIEFYARQSGIPTLARIGDRAISIIAPCLASDGTWHEIAPTLNDSLTV